MANCVAPLSRFRMNVFNNCLIGLGTSIVNVRAWMPERPAPCRLTVQFGRFSVKRRS